jgi:predicted nuclease with TOPRIM domain
MQDEQVVSRLTALKKEFEAGQVRLRELEAEQSYIHETMLRISGAIQILEELVGKSVTEHATGEISRVTNGSLES